MVEHRDRQVGDDKAVGAHTAKHPRDQDPHQRAGKKLADGACLAGADVRVQLPGVLLKNRAQVIKHVLLQAVLAVVGQSVAVEHLVFQKIIPDSCQQGIPAGVGAAFHKELCDAALEIPVDEVVLVLKMVVEGVAAYARMIHNVVDRDLFKRGRDHQLLQAFGQQMFGLIGTRHSDPPANGVVNSVPAL